MKLSDAEYVAAQYRDSANFDARARIYERYDVSPERWPRWLFPRLELRAGERLLELGCGPGTLWRDNAERIPAGLSLVLTDLSPGMLAQAHAQLAALSPQPDFREADAQALPFPDDSFDCVLANHMLYHVPDRARALREVRRVLRRGGRFTASTNAATHLLDLREALARAGLPEVGSAAGEFDLEAATREIATVLRVERVQRRDSALEVRDVETLVAYVRSGGGVTPEDAIDRFRAHVAQQIELAGAFRIRIAAGAVTGVKS
ncbi:MAG: class I SAM-dependent methyltransferase [Myxococcota bacterium]